jgi:hypothetical protein
MVIVSTIARTAASNAWHSGICPVLIIIIHLDYLIAIQCSHSQEVTWLVLPAAWWLNLCSAINATLPRETLASEFNHPQAGYLRIEAIDWNPEGTGVVPTLIVHLFIGFVQHLP